MFGIWCQNSTADPARELPDRASVEELSLRDASSYRIRRRAIGVASASGIIRAMVCSAVMFARIAGVLLATSLTAVAACGSGDKSSAIQTAPSATRPDPATPIPVPANDEPSLEGGLLAAADLGPDWTDQNLAGATIAREYYCGTQVQIDAPTVNAFLIASVDERIVFETIVRFPSDPEARQPMQRFRETAHSCGEYVSTDGVARTTWHIADAPFREFGDESLAFIGTTRDLGMSKESTAYFVMIRRGNLLAFISDLPSGQPDRATTEALVAKADVKFAKVPAEAP